MFTHRFRAHLTQPSPAFVGACAGCAFVPYPASGIFSSTHQMHVQEVYRIAAERTREQLRRRWSRRPQFSAN
jgi:hypothetical protein